MNNGHFYFIADQYFIDFPDPFLMKNKEIVNGESHNRPCFYAFKDPNHKEIYWMIPFSSQIHKFQKIYDNKVQKYKKCDTIVFGSVLGHQKAFLIQNMCPITSKYIHNEYLDSASNLPVRIPRVLENELITKANIILALQRQGKRFIFPDVLKIESSLLKNLAN